MADETTRFTSAIASGMGGLENELALLVTSLERARDEGFVATVIGPYHGTLTLDLSRKDWAKRLNCPTTAEGINSLTARVDALLSDGEWYPWYPA